MALQIFPEPTAASGASDTSFAATIPAVQTTYEHDNEFTAGIYDIVIVPSSTNAQLTFLDASSMLLNTNTASGVVTIQLNSTATKVFITTLAGGDTNAIVKITKSSGLLFPENISSGTLDTITTTGTYNQTGKLAVLAFGGGHAGGKGGADDYYGAAGGASGGVAYGIVYTNSPTSVTIGAAGIATTSNNQNSSSPGVSSFGNLLTSSTNSFFYLSGSGTAGINNVEPGAGSASRVFTSFNGNLTTGGGGGGAGARSNGSMGGSSMVGGGSGIGTGGTSAPSNYAGGTAAHNHNPTTRGTAGTGYASGGGAGIQTGGSYPNAAGRFGGDGAPGVVYVLRGF